MPKVATPKQTGHGGPEFESKTIAYFLTCMLTRTPPFTSQQGTVVRIDFQAGADGWLLEDALLTLANNDITKKVAISVKSNRQFNSNGCPKNLNRLLWDQYLGHTSAVFKAGTDSLCLVESIISAQVSEDLNTLLTQAKVQDAKDWHRRLYNFGYSSKAKRKLYESFQCPEDLVKLYSVDVESIGNMLKHFLHIEMDFERVNSVYEAKSIDLCNLLLVHKDTTDAKKIFEALCRKCRELAPVNGYLDIPTLLNILKKDFVLAGIPDHQSDWKKLEIHSFQKLSLIQNKLGKKVFIDRKTEIEIINERLQSKRICLIEGISGAGKTTLAKEFAESKSTHGKVIWLDAADLDGNVESDLQLRHSLTEIIQFVPTNVAYFFIDGAERLYHERQQQKLALLINSMVSEGIPWKIVITCPTERVDSLLQMLYQHNVNTESINRHNMPVLDEETILLVANHYPQLTALLMHQRLRKILSNLKLFDKLLFNIDKISSLSQIGDIGETHLIDFIWDEEIENTDDGIQKGSFLKIVAEKQADLLLTGISTADFEPANISAADKLKKNGFIRLEQQKIFFTHDLYADWARYKLLLSHSNRLVPFLASKHLSSPLWTNAIRLYGLSLLEKDITGVNWEKAFQSFTENSAQHIIIQNLLLQSFFYAPNAYYILNRQKELLFAEDGRLFKKIVKLFLITATSSNPEILKIAKQIGGFTEAEASAYDRLPILLYWPDVLNFISENLEETLKFDLISIVNIANIWLEKIPYDFIYRKEAGDIALKAAQFIFSEQVKGRYIKDEIKEPVYKGLLLAYPENEKEVSDLCLKICQRTKTEKPSNESEKSITKSVSIMDMLSYPKREGEHWQDGPFERVDRTFRELCLEKNVLTPLLFLNPTLGREILLAVLIEEPRDRYLGMSEYDDHFSIYTPTGWYPPFFLRGPFLTFLTIQPDEGIEFVIRITNFATDRWLENDKVVHKTEQGITIRYNGINKTYYGNASLFGWHKGYGTAPYSLISILMAFEQFFYEEIEKGKRIEKYIEYAMTHSHSLSVLGVLIIVAKQQPQIFLKELKDLLPVHILYNWDSKMRHDGISTGFNDLSKHWKAHIEKWKEKRRNEFPLKDTLIHHFLSNEDLQAAFKKITPYWEEEFKNTEYEESMDVYLFQMIPQFKKENYVKKEENGKILHDFIEPGYISDRLKAARESVLENLQESQVSDKMDMMIEHDLPFDIYGAEYLWKKIQQWATEIDANDILTDYGFASPLSNILASLPVLQHHKNIWINKHPEYVEWIKAFSTDLIDNRLNRNEIAEPFGSSFDWSVKLASMISELWKENIAEKSYRKVVGGLLILFNDATVKAFFESASKLFQWNEPNFIQTQNLFLQYCNEKKASFINTYPVVEQLRPIQEKCLQAFIEGTISTDAFVWPAITDLHKTNILMKCLPDFNAIKDTDQRNYILFLLRQGLLKTVSKFDTLEDRDHPDEFDIMLLSRIAECLPHLNEEERPNSFWTPIFDYGYLAAEWVTVLCNSFFRIHLRDKTSYATFVILLQKMVAFAYQSFTWETKKSFSRSGDFRNCVLGLHPRAIDIWKNDYKEFIKLTAPLYVQWFNKNRYNYHSISAMISLMITKSGEPLLAEILKQLKAFFSMALQKSKETPSDGQVYVGHKDLDDKLASSLGYLWENRKELITSKEETFSDYRELVQYLVAIENVIGIELQHGLIQS